MNTKTTYDYETYHYTFDGCDVAPHCLECPLPRCKYDDAKWYILWKMQKKAEKIKTFDGVPAKDLAKTLGISTRTVQRWRGLELVNAA